MKAITVKQLRKIFDKLDDAGKGDYQVFLTDDEEMNGYHACWYLPEAADEMDGLQRQAQGEILCLQALREASTQLRGTKGMREPLLPHSKGLG